MLGPWISAVAALLVAYWLRSLYKKRFERFTNIPQLPTSYLWGNLITIDEFTRKLPPKAHIDMAFAAMHAALKCPPVMVIDLWPVASPMIMIGSYEVAEQVVASTEAWPYGPPKVTEFWKGLDLLIGPKSLISIGFRLKRRSAVRGGRRRCPRKGLERSSAQDALRALAHLARCRAHHLARHQRSRFSKLLQDIHHVHR